MTLATELQPTSLVKKELIQKPAGILIVLAGPTAVGKTTIFKHLLARYPEMKNVVSMTTREQRKNEVEGFDFHFKTLQEFVLAQESGQLLEWVEYGGEFYGVSKDEIAPVLSGENRIWLVNMARAAEVRDCYDDVFDSTEAEILKRHTLVVLIGTPSLIGLWERYKERKEIGDSRDSFLRRIREDWNVWQEKRHGFDHVVTNRQNSLESTMSQLSDLINLKNEELRTLAIV